MPETLVVQAEIAEFAGIWDWTEGIGQSFGLSQSTLFAIHLCLEEALSNIIQYGFPGGPRAGGDMGVRLSLERVGDAIVLTIADHGVAFDPLTVPPLVFPTTLSEAPTGGRGIHLMRQFSRHQVYERREGTNHLTLRFAYP